MSKQVKFQLAPGVAALRLACATGEIAIDAGEGYSTSDAREVMALDAHPSAMRATKEARKP